MKVNRDKCRGCRMCLRGCPVRAISMDGRTAVISSKCTNCGNCAKVCAFEAIEEE